MTAAIHYHTYILAGGKSSRMGQDKGLMPFGDQPMIARTIAALKPLSTTVHIVTANAAYRQFGVSLIADDVPNLGPLGGITTVLKQASAPMNLFLACDMPLLTTNALTHFLNACKPDAVNVAVCNGQMHPLPGLYPTAFAPIFEAQMAKGQLALHAAVAAVPHHYIGMDDFEDAFVNLNTQSDLSTHNPNSPL